MAGFGYGGYGNMYGGNMQQTFEQERIGYGPQGYGMYEQETILNRNPYTGATTVVRENEFIPMANAGVMGSTFGGGFGPHIGHHHHHHFI